MDDVRISELMKKNARLKAELKQARHYVSAVAAKTSEPKVHHDLAQIDAALAD